MNEILKLGLILGSISAVCVGTLGAVNSMTVPVIEQQKEEAKQQAMRAILQQAENFEVVQIEEGSGVLELYKGVKGNTYVGAVAKIAPEGYGGAIEVLVSTDAENKLVAIEVLSHTETPGLGANLLKEDFKNQYAGKVAPLQTVKGSAGDQEISAITGATITSLAVTEGVNEAVAFIKEHSVAWIEGGNQ